MTKVYEATFVKSSKEGRMGININTFNGFFVNAIKKFSNRIYNEKSKTWFFDAADYDKVRDLVIEAFESPVRVYEIDGTNELFHGGNDSATDINSQDTFVNALIAGGGLDENMTQYN